MLGGATVPLTVQRPAEGHSEQDPHAWFQAMLDAVDLASMHGCTPTVYRWRPDKAVLDAA